MGSHGFVERFISDGELSLVAIKLLNFGFYALCYYAVMQPGRIDGQASQSASKDSKAPDIQDYTRRNSLVTPSNWAFAIWAFIFLGELLFVTSSSKLIQQDSPIAPLFRAVPASFIMAQLYQTFWTQAFRPNFRGNLLCLSSAFCHRVSLSRAYRLFISASLLIKQYQYLLYFFPMTLHFGWTTAASLVNWNGNVATNEKASLRALPLLDMLQHFPPLDQELELQFRDKHQSLDA